MEDCETMEDVYMASVETDRGVKEQLHLYDTRGLQEGVELPKHYFSFADGFVLVYSVNNLESFQRVELLKKEIDKFKDKKEVAIVVLGNKIDLSEQRQVDAEVAQQWARSEKVRLWEVSTPQEKYSPFSLLKNEGTWLRTGRTSRDALPKWSSILIIWPLPLFTLSQILSSGKGNFSIQSFLLKDMTWKLLASFLFTSF
uniref:NFKB inhibitor interacting Ras like 1 n=1 Tax=Felis catus TaxID=9685 RepID=A0ABI7WZJ3_FELCA